MAGTYLARLIVERLSVAAFQYMLDIVMVISGLALLWLPTVGRPALILLTADAQQKIVNVCLTNWQAVTRWVPVP